MHTCTYCVLQLAWVASFSSRGLVHPTATFAGGFLAVMVPTQADQVIKGVWPAGNDVVNVRCFLWATAAHRILPYVPAAVSVSLEDYSPNLVPIRWQGGYSSGSPFAKRILPYPITHRRHRWTAPSTAQTIVQTILKYPAMVETFRPGCRSLFPGL